MTPPACRVAAASAGSSAGMALFEGVGPATRSCGSGLRPRQPNLRQNGASSSTVLLAGFFAGAFFAAVFFFATFFVAFFAVFLAAFFAGAFFAAVFLAGAFFEIGRASCRERVCPYV